MRVKAACVSAVCDFRRLGPFQVNLREYERKRFEPCIREAEAGLDLWLWRGGYDAELGIDAAGLEDLPVG